MTATSTTGAIMDVPVKLTLAKRASSLPITEEKTITKLAKRNKEIFVFTMTSFSFPASSDLSSLPKAKICALVVDKQAANSPTTAKPATGFFLS